MVTIGVGVNTPDQPKVGAVSVTLPDEAWSVPGMYESPAGTTSVSETVTVGGMLSPATG